MCGIVGIYAYHYAAPPINVAELRKIRDAMITRGPDGYGEWISSNTRVGLGHRRLSVIDPSEKGAQPMKGAGGECVISFNGEIYNFKEIRKDLEAKGYHFNSDSDTEVLLHLYADKGEAMVHDLRGMFAFALWDEKRKGIFLARDPYGIKPLYYADDGWTLRIASQVKALLESDKVSKLPDPAGMVGFYLLGSVPEPFTTHQEIRALPAGSTLWVDELGANSPKKYFSLEHDIQSEPEKVDIEFIRESLLESLRYHFVADVPVGLFLSAGIDSAVLVALSKEINESQLMTVTLAFEEFDGSINDESKMARSVATEYETQHVEHVVTNQEFKQELPQILSAMDQPSIDGVNTYYVSQCAHRAGLKVAISGVGADELFAGYPSFRDIPQLVRCLFAPARIPLLPDMVRTLTAGLPMVHPKWSGILKYGGSYPGAYFLKRGLFMPWELPHLMKKDFAVEGLRRLPMVNLIRDQLNGSDQTPFTKISILESSLYLRNQLLRDADWAGMAHSVEIRTPYVDATLTRKIRPALSKLFKTNKHLKKVLASTPHEPLPKERIDRPKTGFQVPMDQWISDKTFDAWRRVPLLAKRKCHWSRRWAYALFNSNA